MGISVAMARIEDYALVGDLRTAALIARDGSLDWLCLPRFDGGACFAALLGTAEHGRWLLAPAGEVRAIDRRYREDALIVETEYTTDDGTVRLTEFMPLVTGTPSVVRIVEGLSGSVTMSCELAVRFGYGDLAPWTRPIDGGCTLTAVGDALVLRADQRLEIVEHDVCARFAVRAGERSAWALSWYPSCEDPAPPLDAEVLLADTERWWREWAAKIRFEGGESASVHRSAIMLKALFSEPFGASIAAITTSLPEALGGDKNWDYRYAWVRDSCFTIDALLHLGLTDEALRWRDWVLRALAGRPEKLQIMYGLGGARTLEEYELEWLPGYEGSRPVRIGNAAYKQFQLGVYGQAMAAMYAAHARGVPLDAAGWEMLCAMLEHVAQVWEEPDSGIWESRAAVRHYTHSKMEAWRAFAYAVRMMSDYEYPGDRARWNELARRVHEQICAEAFDAERGTFVQSYGSRELDASLLLMPLIEFLPSDDPRIVGTLAAIERELVEDGFVYRTTNDAATGAPTRGRSEGVFLACNFWLVENYVQQGRVAEARALFERLVGVAGELGLLSEEYDPRARRLLGNVPQTLSHAALINAAARLCGGATSAPSGTAPGGLRSGR
jgi:GH15 family glucan-1,4-alpha-glucosidase